MPSISQQDYIYIDVPEMSEGEESNIPSSTVNRLFDLAERGLLLDAVLVSPDGSSRIIHSNISGEGSLTLAFYSAADAKVSSWTWNSRPALETENNEEA